MSGAMVDCPSCGRVFETDHGMKVHHAQTHDESLAKKERACENCGNAFEEFQSRIDRGKGRYCSVECRHDDDRVEVTCYHCGDTVKKPEHRVGRYENEYCSKECHRDYRRTGGPAAPGWEGGKEVTKECANCGVDVTRTQSQFEDRVFCSSECFGEAIAGKDHPFWSGGVASWYGETWKKQREKALERDGYVCQSCGISENEYRSKVGRGLDVHHIIPLGAFESGSSIDYKAANRVSNLVSLCLPCHSKWEGIPVAPKVVS